LHELGILINIVETVEAFARENGVSTIQTLVLQVGELSPVIPHYLEECYPAAVDGTMLANTELKLEIIAGEGRCHECNTTFNILQNASQCPHCGSKSFTVLSGREFLIKEIVAM